MPMRRALCSGGRASEGLRGLSAGVCDGWVYAHVQELPEVHTQGESLDDARMMVREAIELVLEDRRERGEAIPATAWYGLEFASSAMRFGPAQGDLTTILEAVEGKRTSGLNGG
jgi:predicted RNase H-like HicB family nuclease